MNKFLTLIPFLIYASFSLEGFSNGESVIPLRLAGQARSASAGQVSTSASFDRIGSNDLGDLAPFACDMVSAVSKYEASGNLKVGTDIVRMKGICINNRNQIELVGTHQGIETRLKGRVLRNGLKTTIEGVLDLSSLGDRYNVTLND